MKITKDQAKQAVAVYSSLLKERAVISDIETEEVRGESRFFFQIAGKYPTTVECSGIKELATLLNAMWSSYLQAYSIFVEDCLDQQYI